MQPAARNAFIALFLHTVQTYPAPKHDGIAVNKSGPAPVSVVGQRADHFRNQD